MNYVPLLHLLLMWCSVATDTVTKTIAQQHHRLKGLSHSTSILYDFTKVFLPSKKKICTFIGKIHCFPLGLTT